MDAHWLFVVELVASHLRWRVCETNLVGFLLWIRQPAFAGKLQASHLLMHHGTLYHEDVKL